MTTQTEVRKKGVPIVPWSDHPHSASKEQRAAIRSCEGTFMSIDKHELELDFQYQRDSENDRVQKSIREMAEHWNWVLCGALIVAMDENGFRVVDGGHRWRAAMLNKHIKNLPCIVFDAENTAHEAEIFVALNSLRRTLTAYDKFRASIVAEDQIAIEVDELVRMVGYNVVQSARTCSGYTVSCVSWLMKHAVKDFSMLTKVVMLAARIYNGGHMRVNMLRGLWRLMKVYRLPLDDKRHRDRLIALGAEALTASIDRSKIAYGGQRHRDLEARAILRALNHGRPKRHRLTIDGEA